MNTHNSISKKIENIFKYISLAIAFLILHIIILNIGLNLINLFIDTRKNIIIASILNSIFNIIVMLVIMKSMGLKKTDIIRKENFKIDILDLMILSILYACFSYIMDLIRLNIETTFFKEFYFGYMKNHIENFTKPQFNILFNDNIILVIFSLTVLPIMEELYFRIFIHKTLIKHNYSINSVIFISALSFGLRHWFQTPLGVINVMFIGVLLSIIMFATKNILYPIFLHGGVRLIMIIYMRISEVDYLNNIQNYNYMNINYNLTIFAILIVFCIISYILRKRILSNNIVTEFKALFTISNK